MISLPDALKMKSGLKTRTGKKRFQSFSPARLPLYRVTDNEAIVMLAVDAPTLGIFQQASKFWRLRISKEFDKPEYYIGQTVLHKMKVPRGEILHPVTVIGLMWTGIDWEYAVLLPEDHPQFIEEDHGWDTVAHWQLEPM